MSKRMQMKTSKSVNDTVTASLSDSFFDGQNKIKDFNIVTHKINSMRVYKLDHLDKINQFGYYQIFE